MVYVPAYELEQEPGWDNL